MHGQAQAARFASRRRGFTLVEMLVVIGIILLLVGILLPAINRAYTIGVRNRMASDLNAIVAALEAYKQDHGDYPRTSPEGRAVSGLTSTVAGGQILCRAMIGQGNLASDGADGNGFRTVPAVGPTVQGKVYGPYLPTDKFLMVLPNGTRVDTNTSQANLNTALLADRNGKAILYYPALKAADPTVAYIGTTPWGNAGQAPPFPMFNAVDNSTFMNPNALKLLLGDSKIVPGTNNLQVGNPGALNGKIDPGEQPEFTGPFLLISAGPDETYGPTIDRTFMSKAIAPSNPCDDVVVGPNYSR